MSKRLHHYLMGRKLSLLDFLLGNATSGNTTLTTGIPQVCELSPLPFTFLLWRISQNTSWATLANQRTEKRQRSGLETVVEETLSLNVDKNGFCLNTTKNHSSVSIPLYSHHTVHGDHKEHPEQLYYCLAWELHHLRLQVSTADREHNWDPHDVLFYCHS